MLASSEIQVAGLKARVAEYTARYNKARAQIQTAPQLEAELTQLNRDYAVHKRNYDDLVARREAASLSGELESSAGVADFRLIDPPTVSSKPVAPNRLLLLPIALFLGVCAGFAVSFAMSQLRPVFHDARSLRTVVGLPLLGVVTMVLSESAKRQRRVDVHRFVAASSGLVGVFIIVIVTLAVTGRLS